MVLPSLGSASGQLTADVLASLSWNFSEPATVSDLGQDRCRLRLDATPRGWSSRPEFCVWRTEGGGGAAGAGIFDL